MFTQVRQVTKKESEAIIRENRINQRKLGYRIDVRKYPDLDSFNAACYEKMRVIFNDRIEYWGITKEKIGGNNNE